MAAQEAMLEHLFGSKTRLRLLRLFFTHPETAYFVREMAREVKSQINAVRRELAHLVDAGIIETTKAALEADGMSLTDGAALLAKRKVVGKQMLADDREARFKQRQKAIGALVRKGYSLKDATRAVDEALDEASAAE